MIRNFSQRIIIVISYIFFVFGLMYFTGEILLRVVYYDGGRTTYKGPGGKEFEYTYNKEGLRDPRTHGPKQSGIKRILILGDSITEGAGVKEWKDLYPQKLLELLNKEQSRYEMDVFAGSGREIDKHLKMLKKIGKTIDPDIIIYQWFVNDIEFDKSKRPLNKSAVWRYLPFHPFLKRHSYLWYFLNNRLEILLPRFNRSYTDYLITDYAEATNNWNHFEILFRRWAKEATDLAEQTIVFLYPTLPYKGLNGKKYPLQQLHDRVKKITGNDFTTYQASAMPGMVGEEIPDNSSAYGVVRKAVAGKTLSGTLVYGPYITLKQESYLASFKIKVDDLTSAHVATIDVAGEMGNVILAQRNLSGLDFDTSDVWKEFELPFVINRDVLTQVEFRVSYSGNVGVAVDHIQLKWPPLKNKIKVLDMTNYLKDMKTWVSRFDAHPTKLIHSKIADILFKELKKE